MAEVRKINEQEVLSRLQPGAWLLSPLRIDSVRRGDAPGADARIEVSSADGRKRFPFVVEAKANSTPQAVRLAIASVCEATGRGENPMILVPYLSPERLEVLEKARVSGVDLCGNGIVIVPRRLLVVRSGNPNRFPESRPVGNPYGGRSGLVGRLLLEQPEWESLGGLVASIRAGGGDISMPQASKAILAMGEDLILEKSRGSVRLVNRPLLLEKLKMSWGRPVVSGKRFLRLPDGFDWVRALSRMEGLRWAMMGASSAGRYTNFSQGAPLLIAVSRLDSALTGLGGARESIPNYADLGLVETGEPGQFFLNEVDGAGVRWASRLQSWLELQAGDARQRDAAADLYKSLLGGTDNGGSDRSTLGQF